MFFFFFFTVSDFWGSFERHLVACTHLHFLTRGGDPVLGIGVRWGQCWWGHAFWCRPPRPQRWTCPLSRSSTGCVAASLRLVLRGSAEMFPPAAPAGKGHWPRGWKHCRGMRKWECEKRESERVLRGWDCVRDNLHQNRHHCKIDVKKDCEVEPGWLPAGHYLVIMSLYTQSFLPHGTLTEDLLQWNIDF